VWANQLFSLAHFLVFISVDCLMSVICLQLLPSENRLFHEFKSLQCCFLTLHFNYMHHSFGLISL